MNDRERKDNDLGIDLDLDMKGLTLDSDEAANPQAQNRPMSHEDMARMIAKNMAMQDGGFDEPITPVRGVSDFGEETVKPKKPKTTETRSKNAKPAHPYTQALISAKPKEHPLENKEHILLEGDIPNAVDIPEGCRFAGRCRYFKEGLCDNRTPKLKDIGNGHYVACHFPLGIDRSKTAADM